MEHQDHRQARRRRAVVNGAKQFITNSGTDISGCVTITAVTAAVMAPRRTSNLIVPNGTPGMRPASPTARWAERVRHPPAHVHRLPRPRVQPAGRRGDGFKQFMQILDGGRIGVAAMGVGRPQGALDEKDIPYAKEAAAPSGSRSRSSRRSRRRSPTSRPRSSWAACWSTAPRSRRTAANLFTLTAAQAKLDHGPPRRARHRGSRPDPRWLWLHRGVPGLPSRDAKILTIGEGTDEVQQMVIARQLGC